VGSRLVSTRILTRFLVLTALATVFALSCNSGPVTTNIVVEEPSCVDGALSMTFTVTSTNSLALPLYLTGSPHVLGTPTITPGTGTFDVVAALNPTALNDVVTLKFSAITGMQPGISIHDVQFYTVPPANIPEIPECPPTHGPVIGTSDGPGLGLHLTVHNPSPEPIVLNVLQLAEAPSVIPGAALDWSYFDSGTIPYINAVPSGTMLAPGSPPIVVDLPDLPAPGMEAGLMRYEASYGGSVHRVVFQADLAPDPVKTENKTWGAIKALYR
jgi:hypothetical protein